MKDIGDCDGERLGDLEGLRVTGDLDGLRVGPFVTGDVEGRALLGEDEGAVDAGARLGLADDGVRDGEAEGWRVGRVGAWLGLAVVGEPVGGLHVHARHDSQQLPRLQQSEYAGEEMSLQDTPSPKPLLQ